ncbi:hypothetical protein JCM15415_12220 [Methanobacterium movens]
MSVKVSVIVPVYNVEQYLSQCLDSLINQTLRDIEIICVDDGSTDNSLKILKEYFIKDNRIRIINQKNLGPGAARNIGLSQAKGKYISFIDSDDWIEKEAYEKLYAYSTKKDLDLNIFSIYAYDEKSKIVKSDHNTYNLKNFDKKLDGKIFNYKDVKDILFHIPTVPFNKLYKKEFLDKFNIKFVEGLYFEDNVFFYDVFLRAKKCAITRNVKVFRRYREGSITQSNDDKYFDEIKIIRLIVEVFKKTNNFKEFKTPLIIYIINLLDWTYSLINEKYKKDYFIMIKKEFEALNLKDDDLEKLPNSIKNKYNNFANIKSGTPLICKRNLNSEKSLIISYAFIPFSDTSAVAFSKRVLNMDGEIDVIQNDISDLRKKDQSLEKIFGHNINKKFILNTPATFFDWKSIKIFVSNGLSILNESLLKNYDKLYSISMYPASHFLAFEYKMINPEIYWVAEFSDPMRYDTEGNERLGAEIHDEKYLDKINKYLLELNLPLAKESVSFLCEYLPFIFADEVIFTNQNQMDYMLEKFPYSRIKGLVQKKSKVIPYPILSKKNYHLVESDYLIDETCVNFAYFGVFYGTRHLESLYYAFENLDENLKKKFKFHIFTDNTQLVKDLTENLTVSDNIKINSYVDYAEFLNLCTKFDCLIVNDAEVKENLSINPYLPSKLMDYLGSGTDIWAICEKGSPLDDYEIKYKSYLDSYNSLKNTIIQIISDKFSDCESDNEINISINKNDAEKNDVIEELQIEISFLKKRNRQLNMKMFRYNYRISSLTNTVLSLKNDMSKKDESIKKLETVKKLIPEVANMKSYRLAYFINRTKNELIKGNIKNKKLYLKWIYLKIFKKENPYNKRNNPLFNILNRIT